MSSCLLQREDLLLFFCQFKFLFFFFWGEGGGETDKNCGRERGFLVTGYGKILQWDFDRRAKTDFIPEKGE